METAERVGEFSIESEGRLIIARQLGPFNLQYAIEFSEQLDRIADAMNATGPYAHLSIYQGLMNYSEDALAYVMERALVIESARHNCVAIALVAPAGVRGLQTMKPAIEAFFRKRGMAEGDGRLFDDVDLARTWVTGRLATHPSSVTGIPQRHAWA